MGKSCAMLLAGSFLFMLLVAIFIQGESEAIPYLLLVPIIYFIWHFIFGGSSNDDDYFDINRGDHD